MLNVIQATNGNNTEILIRSIIDSFFGPNKSLKQVVNDSESILVGCPLSVLQAISLMSPFGHLIQETLSAHHERYGCGTMTLLAMWYFWNKEFKKLIEKGCLLSDIISTAEESLQHVISIIPTVEIPLKKLLSFLDEKYLKQSSNLNKLRNISIKKSNATISSQQARGNQFISPRVLNSNTKNFDYRSTGISHGIMMRSRHFSPAASCQEEHVQSENTLHDSNVSSPDVHSKDAVLLSKNDSKHLFTIARQLSHCTELSDVLAKTWESQINAQRNSRFILDFLSVCPVVGTRFYNDVVDGVLIKTKFQQHIKTNTDKHAALFISGDVTPSYKHLGFYPTLSIESKKSVEEITSTKLDIWLKECTQLLLKLQISLLFIQGTIHPILMDFCESHAIVVVHGISSKTFKLLYMASNGSPASYLLQCDQENRATNISIKNYPLEMTCSKSFSYILVNIEKNNSNQVQPQTIILCHPCQSVLDLREHQFWHIASRLALVTKCGVVLPGGGLTEKWCSQVLYSFCSTKQKGTEIIKAVADGYLCYWEEVSKKLQLADVGKTVDEMESKIQAWKSALALLLVSLQTDSVVLNGCNRAIQKSLHEPNMIIGTF